MTTIVGREISLCYGHRLVGYAHKCRFLHGHNGKAVLLIGADGLTSEDIDRIYQDIAGWIDDHIDHKMLLNRKDPVLPTLQEQGESVYVMEGNPTAEAIAQLIYEYAIGRGYPIVEVRFWESDKNSATYQPIAVRVSPQSS